MSPATAGVSVATVSHVLNRTRFVSQQLTQRVLQAAEALNYAPNVLDRGLRSRHMQAIGLILLDVANRFLAEESKAVQAESAALGYQVFVCQSDEALDKEQALVSLLESRSVDGRLKGANYTTPIQTTTVYPLIGLTGLWNRVTVVDQFRPQAVEEKGNGWQPPSSPPRP